MIVDDIEEMRDSVEIPVGDRPAEKLGGSDTAAVNVTVGDRPAEKLGVADKTGVEVAIAETAVVKVPLAEKLGLRDTAALKELTIDTLFCPEGL